uniref:Uncharacterized protein n=1 Tax=Oryza sativa subsp. japonica TaxID=39947 RepID=Q7XHK7_ORYSJ|nr:hypothetical protein [Oryza sativa Japonica Group]BAD30117.1 hypothetical protein [Oryza sativa Japonica Group]
MRGPPVSGSGEGGRAPARGPTGQRLGRGGERRRHAGPPVSGSRGKGRRHPARLGSRPADRPRRRRRRARERVAGDGNRRRRRRRKRRREGGCAKRRLGRGGNGRR